MLWILVVNRIVYGFGCGIVLVVSETTQEFAQPWMPGNAAIKKVMTILISLKSKTKREFQNSFSFGIFNQISLIKTLTLILDWL